MATRKTELPGVGTKHTIDLEGEEQLVCVRHRVGHWELARVDAEGNSTSLLQLSADDAAELGRVLAREEAPKEDARREMLFRTIGLEWVTIDEGSPLEGRTLGQSDIRARTGASVIAVLRGEESIPSPPPDFRFERGDTLVVLGRAEQVKRFVETFARSPGAA
jgi:TrkA domain protein